ncbi:MAG TPA: MerR family transcriptional regulator [Longimicrobium sp.]|jgi:DNA-binding transcriptional MerR regulator
MYRIKRVAHLTGINPATLRAWERRYNLISPQRTESGYRLYSDEDVAMLTRIKQLTDEGLTISEAIARVGRGRAPLPADAHALLDLRGELRDALLRFDRPAALAAYERAAHLPAELRVEQLLLPMMRELGDLWEHGDAVVSQEHFASAFVREKLSQLIAGLDTGAAAGPEGVCAGLPGELHEFGLMAAAVRLAREGWRVLYLGADVPLEDVRRVLRERRPRMLCTSAVMRLDPDEFRALAAELRGAAPRDTDVVIGGAGIPPLEGGAVPGVRLPACVSEIFSVN